MSNLAFDTHKFVKDLTRNGMPDKQAEVLADHYASLLTDRLATKEDLFGLRKELKGDINTIRSELKGDIGGLRKELKGDIGALDRRITHEISGLRKELKGDIGALDQRITHEISGLRKELKGDIEALRKDMMITILSAQLVGIVTICTIIGFMLNL